MAKLANITILGFYKHILVDLVPSKVIVCFKGLVNLHQTTFPQFVVTGLVTVFALRLQMVRRCSPSHGQKPESSRSSDISWVLGKKIQ